MLIRKPDDIPSSEITDEKLYLNRRNFIRGGVLVGTAAATTLLYRRLAVPAGSSAPPSSEVTTRLTSELGETATSYEDITTYNNFYEF